MYEVQPYQPYQPSQTRPQQAPQQGYLGRAWALLTRDRGWVKPVLLLTLASLVPIVGPLGVLGYEVEWSRLVAWGHDAAPKQKDVQLGGCLASGWRSFLVILGWTALVSCMVVLLAFVPLAGTLLATLGLVALALLGAFLPVPVLRASLYQRVGAGYKLDTILDMFERDRRGAWRVAGIAIVGGLLLNVVFGLLAILPIANALLASVPYVSFVGEVEVVSRLVSSAGSLVPAYMALLVAYTFSKVVLDMLVYGAAGLYMRQFDVAAWGSNDDPLPAQPASPYAPYVPPYQPPAANAAQALPPVASDADPYASQEQPPAADGLPTDE